jgi:CheY-like chemotaxis protein
MGYMTDRKYAVLVIDENLDELFLIRHALEQQGLACDVLAATDEGEVADHLRTVAQENRRLDLVIIDLSQPRDRPGAMLHNLEEFGFGSVPVILIAPADSAVSENVQKGDGVRLTFPKPHRWAQYLEIGSSIKSMLVGKAKASDA